MQQIRPNTTPMIVAFRFSNKDADSTSDAGDFSKR